MPYCLKYMRQVIALLLFFISQVSMTGQTVIFNQLNLLQGKKKVTIPFNYINNFIILDVKMFGSLPMHLIFDTGAEHVILFKREYTDILQVQYDKRIPIVGSDLSRQIYALVTRNAALEVTGLPVMPYDILVLEEDYYNLEELIGTAIDGVIGGG